MNSKCLTVLFILVVLVLAATTSYSRVKPIPINAESILREYFQIIGSENSEERFKHWCAGKTESELAVIPIVVGFGLLNQIEGSALTDSLHYAASSSAIGLIEKGVGAIETAGNYDALYFTTDDAGLIPVKYILANAYDNAFRYAVADSLYNQTASEIGRDFGLNSEEFVYWTNQCAESIQRKNKNYDRAIQLLLPAKEAALSSKEVSDSTSCTFLLSLAQKYKRSGNHIEAKLLAHEAEKRTGGNHRLVFQVSNTLGEIYLTEGQIEIGAKYFHTAESNAPSLPDFFAAGINYANILRKTGYFDDAETTLLALEKYLNSGELLPDNLFHYYESMGVLYTFSNPAKSKDCFRKAEEYINFIDYPTLVRHILNSQVFPNEDNSFKIISALDRAEQVFNMFIGNEPRLRNELLSLKGHYLLDIHDYKNARSYYEAAYVRMLDYATGDPEKLVVLNRLAFLDEIENNEIRRGYYLQEQLREASVHGESSDAYAKAIADLLHYSLQIKNEDAALLYSSIYDKLCPNAFDTHCYRYRFKQLQGKTIEAKEILDKLKTSFPKERHLVNRMLQRFYYTQKSSEICQVADSVFSTFKTELLRKLLYMSNNERRNMDSELRAQRDEIISAIRFAPDLTELALEYTLFSKGLLFHTQHKIDNLLLASDSAKMEVATIRNLKAELTRAINSSDKGRIYSIQNAIESRERYLIDDYIDNSVFAEELMRYSAKSLYKYLPGQTVLLDFVEYSDSVPHIGGFIIDSVSPVRFIDFGKISDLDNSNITSRIWDSITPYIQGSNKIYFSTDGILNNIPIEFAEDAEGRPMCEKYVLHRVFHLSDIRPCLGIGNRVEAIGVSDHNSPSGKARGLNDDFRGNWSDLAGVETELYRIAESLNGYRECHRTFNDDATERYVKSLSGQPITTLHISTHGFYRGEDALLKAFNDSNDLDHKVAHRFLMGNRTSVSGLVMRNGNISWLSETVSEDEDNLLTSEEIETLTFPCLNLTVLSACETGLGELSADGVWGLQRAFRIAGSSAIICSLHRVNDNGTADFMGEFYRHASTGISIHDAFYNARKELLSQDPDSKETWSSFILIE